MISYIIFYSVDRRVFSSARKRVREECLRRAVVFVARRSGRPVATTRDGTRRRRRRMRLGGQWYQSPAPAGRRGIDLRTPRRPAKMASRRAQLGGRGPRLSYWTGVWGGHECASAAAATKGSPPSRDPPSIIGRSTLQPSSRNFVWIFFFVFFQFFLRFSRYSPFRPPAQTLCPNAVCLLSRYG